MIYDVIIIGGGAAGLFSGIHLDKKLKKLILEKNPKPGIKVLLSGGERANVSNMDIVPERDYFTQNKKFLISVFTKYSNWDLMSFFAEKGINIIEEDRSRLILESGDSKELVACLEYEVRKNNCELRGKSNVKKINLIPNPSSGAEGGSDIYILTLETGEKFQTKNVIVSSGGKSFFQVGTTGEGYNFAESFGLDMVLPYRALGGLSTKKDLSEISGLSCNLSMKLFDRNTSPLTPLLRGDGKKINKSVYEEVGPLLFTHFGVSGPIIFNAGNALGEYINSLKICKSEEEMEKYILGNMYLELSFDVENTPKRAIKFFELLTSPLLEDRGDGYKVTLDLQNFRSWKEAKATGGGISTNELDNTMQAKKAPGLYFIGEVVDVTGKTGGFNLQRAWSSAFVSAMAINKKQIDS